MLNTFSLSGNEALCACHYDVVGSNADPYTKENLIRLLRMSGYDVPGNEIPDYYFANGEDCATKVDITSYCKFGPSGEIIFNS